MIDKRLLRRNEYIVSVISYIRMMNRNIAFEKKKLVLNDIEKEIKKKMITFNVTRQTVTKGRIGSEKE